MSEQFDPVKNQKVIFVADKDKRHQNYLKQLKIFFESPYVDDKKFAISYIAELTRY